MNVILMTGVALALVAVATAVHHVILALTARKTFVGALSKWLTEDYEARGEAERTLRQSPRALDDNLRRELDKIICSLPRSIGREILSGLENNSDEGRSKFMTSILADALAENRDAVAKSDAGVTLDEPEPSLYETAGATVRSRLAPLWPGGIGFVVGTMAALAMVRLGDMDLSDIQQKARGDEVGLPKDLVELQRKADLQEIDRLVEMINRLPEGNVLSPTVSPPQAQAEAVALNAKRAVEEGKQHPQEILGQLKQIGNSYMKLGDYDNAQAYLEAASKVANEIDFKDEPWATVLGVYKMLGDLYAQKGDAHLARSFYERSLNQEPGSTPDVKKMKVQ